MLPDALVFSVEGVPYGWRDVILSAARGGEWQAAEARARCGAACACHADATHTPIATAQLDAAGREFRYARNLVTAQAMEDWLAERALSVQDWTAHLRRALLRARSREHCDELAARHSVTDDVAIRLTLIDVVCSQEIDEWARALAARAAVHASFARPADDSRHPDDEAPRAMADAAHVALLSALWGDDANVVDAAAQRLEDIDASMRDFRAAQLSDRALNEYLGARQLEWVRVDCRVMSFPDEGMAAEAALLLREDDEGFTNVYRVAHVEPRTVQFYLDSLDDVRRDHFLKSRAGDLVGPLRIDGAFVLYEVEEKVLPSLKDADIRRRAEAGVLAAALQQQSTQRVTWHQLKR